MIKMEANRRPRMPYNTTMGRAILATSALAKSTVRGHEPDWPLSGTQNQNA